MYKLGIDLGGTNIKAGICDENGKILTSAENCNIVNSAVTNAKQHIDAISFNI